MVVGTYTDGRPLTYDPGTRMFAVGGAPVTLSQVLQYDAAGQLTWTSAETGAWARGLAAPPPVTPVWEAAPAVAVNPAPPAVGASTPPPFPAAQVPAATAPPPLPPSSPAATPPFPPAESSSPARPAPSAGAEQAATAGIAKERGSALTDWLVVVGGLLFLMSDFVWWAMNRYYDTSTGRWTSWQWSGGVGARWWTTWWSEALHPGEYLNGWENLIGGAALHVASVLCVVAVILALWHILGGARAGGRLILATGILATCAVAFDNLFWAVLSTDNRNVSVTTSLSLVGAVMILIAGIRMMAGRRRGAGR